MARKVEVQLIDDIDGGKADETLSFALDGVQYEIDVNSKHAEKLRAALAEYVTHGRRVGKSNVTSLDRYRAKGKPVGLGREQNNKIRAWANSHVKGCVNDRGRIPEQIVHAYDKQDPGLIPGYVKPNVTAVSFKPGTGEATVKTEGSQVPKQPSKATRVAKSTRAAVAASG